MNACTENTSNTPVNSLLGSVGLHGDAAESFRPEELTVFESETSALIASGIRYEYGVKPQILPSLDFTFNVKI